VRRDRGFTLIEVLVAMVVTVAAVAILAQGFSTGARASVLAEKDMRAALLAQRVITDFELGVVDLSSNQAGTFDDEPDFTYETTSDVPTPSGTTTTGIDYTQGLTLLTINIKWDDRGKPRIYTVTRLMLARPTSTSGSSSSSSTPSSP
jgi:prepilin-type N-terminal cleavage/methylation domain-containing protein